MEVEPGEGRLALVFVAICSFFIILLAGILQLAGAIDGRQALILVISSPLISILVILALCVLSVLIAVIMFVAREISLFYDKELECFRWQSKKVKASRDEMKDTTR